MPQWTVPPGDSFRCSSIFTFGYSPPQETCCLLQIPYLSPETRSGYYLEACSCHPANRPQVHLKSKWLISEIASGTPFPLPDFVVVLPKIFRVHPENLEEPPMTYCEETLGNTLRDLSETSADYYNGTKKEKLRKFTRWG